MGLVKGKYYKLRNFYFRVHSCTEQEEYAAYIIRITDWIGNFEENKINDHGQLGKSKLIKVSYKDFLEITKPKWPRETQRVTNDHIISIVERAITEETFPVDIKYTQDRRILVDLLVKFAQMMETRRER